MEFPGPAAKVAIREVASAKRKNGAFSATRRLQGIVGKRRSGQPSRIRSMNGTVTAIGLASSAPANVARAHHQARALLWRAKSAQNQRVSMVEKAQSTFLRSVIQATDSTLIGW